MLPLKRALLAGLVLWVGGQAATTSGQPVDDYLRFFRSAVSAREPGVAKQALLEMERFLLAYGTSPSVPEVLRLRTRLLVRTERCLEAGVCLIKSWLVFRDSVAHRELTSLPGICRKTWASALRPLLQLRTAGLSRESRATQFTAVLLELLPSDRLELAGNELRWFLTWFPQAPGSDSVRVAYAGFLERAGRRSEALREYLTFLQIRNGNKHTASAARRAAMLARDLGRRDALPVLVQCLGKAANSVAVSEKTRAEILVACAEICADDVALRPKGKQALGRLLDQVPVPYVSPRVLWTYAGIYREAGQMVRSAQCLRFLVERFPDDPRAAEAQALLAGIKKPSEKMERVSGSELAFFGKGGLRFPLSEVVAREVKRRLLAQINRDRAAHGLQPVAFDSLASVVADEHCKQALQHNYHGHFDLHGFKPHHRYALAGGYDVLAENFSLTTWRGFDISFDKLVEMVLQAHRKMMQEKPPNDGHRRNVLAPQHNACGIGLAVSKRGLRFSEEFLDRYVHLDVRPPINLSLAQARSETLWVTGRALNGARVVNASIDYEPWPQPMTPAQISRSRSYSLPGFTTSLVRLVQQARFEGRSQADTLWYWKNNPQLTFHFTSGGTEFRLPVVLPRPRSGIYTVTIWVRTARVKKVFPAAYVCLFVK